MEKKVHKAKKSFGQHFLKDNRVLTRIVQTANLSVDSVVLEIGPGKGALTKKLLEAGLRVVAVEKDYDLLPVLQEAFSSFIASGALTLVSADIMQWLPKQTLLQDQKYHVIANIPYNITGLLIEALLTAKAQPKSMTLLVQKEVADRIVAKDNKGSILSWAVRFFGTPKLMFTVPKTAFRPPPKVTSAVFHIHSISRGVEGVSHDFFFKVLHLAFAHKRKQLYKNLRSVFNGEFLDTIWKTLQFKPTVRAEDLSWEEWLGLVRVLSKK